MNKWTMLLVLVVMLAVQAYAAVDVTYSFNQQNFTIKAFNCLNSDCSQVAPFSGSIIKGPNSTDGSVIVRYPDSLATPYGYAEFVVSPGFRPLIGKHSWHTFGQGGVAQTSQSFSFVKAQNCAATVSQLSVENTVEPFKPLALSTRAQLDANTASAFTINPATGVRYFPPEWTQEFAGADTVVALEILNGTTIIHRQGQNFTAKQGNTILASSSVPALFTYIPSAQGNFTARVVSQVVDLQCQTSQISSAQSAFNVFLPQSQFYSILQNLSLNSSSPRVNEPLAVVFSKLTNHVSANGTLTPVQTDSEFVLFNETGVEINQTRTLFANPSSSVLTVQNFTFLPRGSGNYTVQIRARANSALPTNQPEFVAQSNFSFVVQNNNTARTVTFLVRNGKTGTPLSGTNITFAGNTVAGLTDITHFFSVAQGTYTYIVLAENFSAVQASVQVIDDTAVTVFLYPGNTPQASNTPPLLNLPDRITILENRSASLNLSDFAQDGQDLDSSLRYTITGNTTVAVLLAGDKLTFNSYASGTNHIMVRVNDSQNASATDVVEVVVVSQGIPPSWKVLPDVRVAEDAGSVQIDLGAFVNAVNTVDSVQFFVSNLTNPGVFSVTLENNRFAIISPNQNKFGNGTFDVEVRDDKGSATSRILVNVTPVADAPQVITVPILNATSENTSVGVNLSNTFFDGDGDIVNFAITPTANISFVVNTSQMLLVIIPDKNVFGVRTFNVTAVDSTGLTATAQFSLTILQKDDPPFLNARIPDVVTLEETVNSIDLTPFENDFEDVPGDNNNLTWKIASDIQINNTPPNRTPVTMLDTHIFSAVINRSTDVLLVTPKPNQSGIFVVTLFLFDEAGNNVSQDIGILVNDVNDAPAFVNLSNQSAQAGLSFFFDVNASDAENNSFNFTDNSTLFDINLATGLINFTPRTTGLFNMRLQVCDSVGACTNGLFSLTITDTVPPSPGGQVSPANGTLFGLNISYRFGINWTDNGNVSNVTFEFNNVNFTNVSRAGDFFEITLQNLSAGNHSFRWFANDTANNMNVTNLSVFTIVQPLAQLVLTLSSVQVAPASSGGGGGGSSSPFNITSDVNLTETQFGRLSVFANPTNTTGIITVVRNGTVVVSNTSPVSVNLSWTDVGKETVVVIFEGNQNFRRSNVTLNITVLDRVAPVFGSESVSPVNPAQFSSLYVFRRNVTDNTGVETVLLQIDGSGVVATRVGNSSTYEANVSALAVGNHSYFWFANDNQTNSNVTANATYTVNKGVGAVDLLINGAQADTTAQVNDSVSILANLTNPTSGAVSIFVNGVLEQTGASPLVFTRAFASLGVQNITAVFAGDTNASNATASRKITITPIVGISGVAPANGTEFNFSSFFLAVNTNAATSCSFDGNDVPQVSMRNNFTTTNGTAHRANVSLVRGVNAVSIACNNQSA